MSYGHLYSEEMKAFISPSRKVLHLWNAKTTVTVIRIKRFLVEKDMKACISMHSRNAKTLETVNT